MFTLSSLFHVILIFLFRHQVFRNQNLDFFPRPNSLKPKPWLFSGTKFSETETDTFFRGQIFSKPKAILFFRDQIFRNRNQNHQKIGKSFETEKFRNRNVNLCLEFYWSAVAQKYPFIYFFLAIKTVLRGQLLLDLPTRRNLNLDLNYKCTLDYVIYIPLDARRPERLSITFLIAFFGHLCFIIYLPYKR